MVHDMCVDDAVEEVAADPAKVSIHGGECPFDKGPVLGIKVMDLRVSVVEVGNGN